MNQKLQLIIPFKKNMHDSIISVGIMILIFLSLYVSLSAGNPFAESLGPTIVSGIRVIIICLIGIFIAALAYNLSLSKSSTPAAILSEEGVWVRYYGLIPWHEITEFGEYIRTPIVGIGIRVKDLDTLSKQAAFTGKCGIFWSKRFGYPPVILANLDLGNEEIMSFARELEANREIFR